MTMQTVPGTGTPLDLPFMAHTVTSDWLVGCRHRDEVRILDVRTDEQLPADHPLRRAAFDKGHLPGAIYLGDIEVPTGSDISSALVFASTMSQRGIGDEHVIVVCGDGQRDRDERVLSALRTMGHLKSFVLEGGVQEWQRKRQPVSRDAVGYAPASFTAKLVPQPANTQTRIAKRRHNNGKR